MLKLWKASTAVFILQVVVGLVVYMITADIRNIVVAATFASILVLIGVYIKFSTVPALVALVGSVVFATLALMDTMVNLVDTPFTLLFVTFAVGYSMFAAGEAKKTGAKENRFALFVTVLPLGIGTVLGGLLYFVKYRNRTSATA